MNWQRLLAALSLVVPLVAHAAPVDDRNPVFVGPGVQVGKPTGGDMGPGTLNIQSGYYIDGQPLQAGGTVTNVQGGTANGATVTVVNPSSTPTIAVAPAVTGILKGVPGAFSAATPGTDYLAPTSNGSGLTGLIWSQIGSTPNTLGGYGITDGLVKTANLSDLANAATARTNLGLGSIATQSAGAVAITGGSIVGADTTSAAVTPSGGSPTTLGAFLAAPNATTTFQIANKPVLFLPPGPTSAYALIGGPSSAASAPSNLQFLTTFGAFNLESYSGSASNESAAFGMGAGIAQVSGTGFLGIGTSAGAAETIAGGIYVCAEDCGRDAYTTSGGTQLVVGNQSIFDGTFAGPNVVLGSGSLTGNAGIITLAEPYTVGDVLTLNVSTANACNGTTKTVNCTTVNSPTVNYTLVTGDTTLTTLATHLATAWSNGNIVSYTLGDGVNEASHNLFQMQWSQFDASGHPGILIGHFPGSWQLSFTVSCSGTCGGSATVSGPFTGINNTLVGTNIMNWAGATTASNNALLGIGSAQNAATTLNGNSGVGFQMMPNATTAAKNAMNGIQALYNCTTCQNNVVNGAFAGYGITTGQANSILGAATTPQAQAGITTGSNNVEIGIDAIVPSPTAQWQLSIMDAIYGANNSGINGTISAGCIGFYTTSCTSGAVQTAVQFVEAAYTVATLPTGQTGGHVYVTDATTCTFGSTPVGGGSTKCPLFYNGSAWVGG